jgi:hypothetical protein
MMSPHAMLLRRTKYAGFILEATSKVRRKWRD